MEWLIANQWGFVVGLRLRVRGEDLARGEEGDSAGE